MSGDWVKLHRKMLESPIFRHDGLFHLWSFCLLYANWKPAKWLVPGTLREIQVGRGQFVTGRLSLHQRLYPERDLDGRPVKREWTPNPRTLWRWLEALEGMGCVNLLNVSNRCTLVTVCNYALYQDLPDSECPTGVQPTSNRCPTDVQPVSTTEEGKKVRKEDKDALLPFFDTTTPKSQKLDAPVTFPEPLDTPAFRDAWARWEKHRREIKEPLTPSMREAQLKKLASWGEARATACIDHTIFKGWQGLREPDPAERNGHAAKVAPRLPPPPPRVQGAADQGTWRQLLNGVGEMPTDEHEGGRR